MIQTILLPLLSMDIRTMISVLFWGNLISVLLIVSFMVTTPWTRDKQLSMYCVCAKAFQAAAYFLLFFRGMLPDTFLVNLGNSSLLVGFCWEALAMLTIVSRENTRIKQFVIGITGICIILFNCAEYINPNPSFRIVVASLCVFMTLLVPTLTMLMARNLDSFKRIVALFYCTFIVMLLPRAYYAMQVPIHVMSNTLIQTLTFLSMLLLTFFCLPAYLLLEKERSDKIIEDMASSDVLTGLMNRHSFREAAAKRFAEHAASGTSLSFLMFDLDDFGNINDRYGQSFGDMVLRHFAELLKKDLRTLDLACRYGGEEFVVLLSHSDIKIARVVALRIIKALEEREFENESGFHVTVSVGATGGVPEPGERLDDFLDRADKGLYIAKHTGKNKFVVFQKTPPE